MTKGLRQHIERLSRSAKGKTAAEKRRAAIGSWAAMVGAMIMARFSDDPKLSEELLVQTRAWIAGAATSRGRTVTR
jgi:TetR/AcrR family transcriptional repressor of nem operon